MLMCINAHDPEGAAHLREMCFCLFNYLLRKIRLFTMSGYLSAIF